MIYSKLCCPICKKELIKDISYKLYICDNNHTFDKSKEGYVNLLMCNQKRSKNPGDSKEMILSRKEFLAKGYYKELSNKLSQVVLNNMKKEIRNSWNIMDLGCGEGYYLKNLINYFQENGVEANFYGMDISKDAIKYACKSNKGSTLIVGNNFSIPMVDNSLDYIISVFSPIDLEECKRVLKENGFLIRVLPGPNHLIQIRNIIYPKVILKEDDSYKLGDNEITMEETKVTYNMNLNKEDVLSLVKMTPHYWKTSSENKDKLNNYDFLDVTIEFKIGVFKLFT